MTSIWSRNTFVSATSNTQITWLYRSIPTAMPWWCSKQPAYRSSDQSFGCKGYHLSAKSLDKCQWHGNMRLRLSAEWYDWPFQQHFLIWPGLMRKRRRERNKEWHVWTRRPVVGYSLVASPVGNLPPPPLRLCSYSYHSGYRTDQWNAEVMCSAMRNTNSALP